jgi:site-specific DNA recombinase|tara:strand:- start:718 stop:1407 length:690 start_codon:yes stop_codon:yes gene_type:complete
MKKVVGYIRCSTQRQVEEGDTLRNQKNRITDWCERNGYELVTIFEDGGKSGGAKVRTNTFQTMMKMVTNKEIDGIVCNKVSRFGRRLSVMVASVETMTENDVKFYTISEGIDTGTSQGRLMLNMIGSVAEMERDNIRENIKEVLDTKKQNGEKFCRGVFGLKVVNGKFVKSNKEIKVRRRIKLLSNKGYSLNQISNILNKDKVKTKLGGIWYRQSVKNVLDTNLNEYIR